MMAGTQLQRSFSCTARRNANFAHSAFQEAPLARVSAALMQRPLLLACRGASRRGLAWVKRPARAVTMAICGRRNALDGPKMTCLRSDPPVGTAHTEVRTPGRPCKRKSVCGWSSERAAAGAGRLVIGCSTAAELVGRAFIHLDLGQDLSENKICH